MKQIMNRSFDPHAKLPEKIMNASQISPFLRRVLFADAATSAAAGLLMLCGAGLLEPLLGIPEALTRYAGLSLMPFAAFVAWLATRQQLSRAGVWAVIALNALWVVDSIVLLLSGWIQPSVLGQAYVMAQAVVVAALAELEYIGLRRADGQVALRT